MSEHPEPHTTAPLATDNAAPAGPPQARYSAPPPPPWVRAAPALGGGGLVARDRAPGPGCLYVADGFPQGTYRMSANVADMVAQRRADTAVALVVGRAPLTSTKA